MRVAIATYLMLAMMIWHSSGTETVAPKPNVNKIDGNDIENFDYYKSLFTTFK